MWEQGWEDVTWLVPHETYSIGLDTVQVKATKERVGHDGSCTDFQRRPQRAQLPVCFRQYAARYLGKPTSICFSESRSGTPGKLMDSDFDFSTLKFKEHG